MRKKSSIALLLVIALLFFTNQYSYADVTSNYQNPLMRGADPTIVRADDGYYYSGFAVDNNIYIKKSETILGVAAAKSRLAWARPADQEEFGYVWGPYIYRLDGKWYIYFTSGEENSYGYGHPNSYVLENSSPDPFEGTWVLKGGINGKLNTEGNGLACGVVTLGGKRYFTYTKYFWNETNTKFDESPTIVEMENPWTLKGAEGTLARPLYDWEKYGDNVNEGAAVVERDGKTYFAYSASSFMNDNYSVALSTANSEDDLLDSNSWTKHPVPILSKSPENSSFGPGSPLFVKSEDGSEDWLVYHAGPVGGQTGSNRWVRAQRINWNDDGFINLGIPSNPGTVLGRPSGEEKSELFEAEDASYSGVTRTILSDSSKSSGSGVMQYNNSAGDFVEFTVNTNSAGSYSLNFRYNNNTTESVPMKLGVNQDSSRDLSFWSNAGNEFNYDLLRVDNVQLKAGSNKIRLTADEANGLVLDALIVKRSTMYEAENADLTGGAAIASNHSGYSGTGFVEGMWNKGASAQFSVDVPYTGNYSVNLRYSNGFTDDKTLSVYVNGVKVKRIALLAYGDWDKWADRYDNIELKAGHNTITYQYDNGDSGDTNLDSISVAEATTWHYEAENGILSGNANLAADQAGYTGTGYATGLTSVNSAVDFAVNVENSAVYDFKLRFSNSAAESKTLSLYLNGVKVKQLSFSSTGEGNSWSEVLETVNLNKGNNTIAFKYDAGDSGEINIDNIHLNKRIPWKYQAEDANLQGGTHAATDHLWYEGTGFAGGFESVNESIRFNVNVPNTASYPATLRYSGAQSSDITITLYVNGNRIKQLSLTPTADWDSWSEATETLNLNAGNNTIEYKREIGDTGRFNMDSITIDKFSGGNTGFNNNGVVSGTVYKIISKRSGKALDVSGYSSNPGALIDQWAYVGGNNQRWEIVDVGNGYYKIKSAHSGLVLDIVDESPEENIAQAASAETDSQQWRLEKAEGYYKIINKSNGKVLDVSNESYSNGANVHLWEYVGKDNQLWTIETPSAIDKFEGVTEITDVPAAATAGTDLMLQGNIVPGNATNQTILWSVKDAGSTGAAISGNLLSASHAGTVVVTATVMEGMEDASNYTQDFIINVDAGQPTMTDAIISPSSVNYDLHAPGDVSTNITWNSASNVTDVVYGGNSIPIEDGYVVTGDTLTVTSEYLASLELVKGEKAEFEISFDEGSPAIFTVNMIDSTDPVPLSHDISVENNGGGTAGANPVSAAENTEITLTATPKAGYHFKEWQVVSPAGLTITGNTFIMPNEAVTVKVVFEQNPVDTPSAPATPAAPSYTANIKVIDAAGNGSKDILLPIKVDVNTGISILDASSLRDLIGGDGTAVITVPSIPNVNTYTMDIPVSYLLTADRQGALMLHTDQGSITIPSNMLTGVSGTDAKKAEISIGQGDKSKLQDAVKKAIGNRPLMQLTLTLDGKPIEWNSPGAPVNVSIPYTPTAEERANPESIVIWYIDGSGNTMAMPNGHYDQAADTVSFKTTHFSYFAVGYKKVGFADVAQDAWYNKAVSFIAARDISTGMGNGNYAPDSRLTRGQLLVMLMRAYGLSPDINPQDNFNDAGSTYYSGYLAAAKRLKIAEGVGSNSFAPDREITRQEMFTLLYNALKAIGQLPQGNSGQPLSSFSDAGQVDSWAKEAMTLLTETGTIGGNNGKLSPTSTTTRAEMAQVLYNLLAK
jgi:Predicted beta-xylosidase